MGMIPHLKKELKMIFKNNMIYIITFVLFPLFMSLIYGNMQKGMFDGTQEIETINVEFKYNEDSNKGKIFENILNSDGMDKLIKDVDSDGKFIVTIDDDFKNIDIESKNGSQNSAEILKSFLKMVTNNMSQQDIINDRIQDSNVSVEEKQKVYENIGKLVSTQFNNSLFIGEEIEGYKKLSANEYYSISLFIFALLFLSVTVVNNFYKEKEEGLVKRILASPTNRIQYFLSQIFNAFISSLIVSILYITLVKIMGIGFGENLIVIFTIALLESLFIASIAGIIIAFIKQKKLVTLLSGILLAVLLFIGGVFFPIDFMVGGEFVKQIGRSLPTTLMIDVYKDFAITGNVDNIVKGLVVIAVTAIILIVISFIKISKKWEV